MKKTSIIFIVALVTAVFVGCNEKQEGKNQADAPFYKQDFASDDTTYRVQVNIDTLTGRFRGDGIDTLVCKALDSYSVEICSTNSKRSH